jgi:hypothetical protein
MYSWSPVFKRLTPLCMYESTSVRTSAIRALHVCTVRPCTCSYHSTVRCTLACASVLSKSLSMSARTTHTSYSNDSVLSDGARIRSRVYICFHATLLSQPPCVPFIFPCPSPSTRSKVPPIYSKYCVQVAYVMISFLLNYQSLGV